MPIGPDDVPQMPHDDRTFQERVAQVNVGFIVSLEPDNLTEFARLVDDAIKSTGGMLRYTLESTKRLSLREFRPYNAGRNDRRDGDRGGRDGFRPRRQFDYGNDR